MPVVGGVGPLFKIYDISPSLYVLPEKSGPVKKVQWQLTEIMMARPRC